MSVRVSGRSVFPPVRRDRVIAQLPQCFRKEAAVHTENDFNNKVKTACHEQRTGTVGQVYRPEGSVRGLRWSALRFSGFLSACSFSCPIFTYRKRRSPTGDGDLC